MYRQLRDLLCFAENKPQQSLLPLREATVAFKYKARSDNETMYGQLRVIYFVLRGISNCTTESCLIAGGGHVRDLLRKLIQRHANSGR